MRDLNERMNDNVVIINVGAYPVSISTQDKPEGIIIGAGKTVSVLVKDLLSTLRGNKFVYGVDEKGTNANLYIDDSEIRELLKFDEYEVTQKETKGKGDKPSTFKEEKKLIKAQVVLSKDVFIKNVKVQANTDFVSYINSLKEVTNGCKMMIARIILDEKTKLLKSVSIGRINDLENIISH